MITNGRFFSATLDILDFDGDAQQKEDTKKNATNIVGAVIRAYGVAPDGEIGNTRPPSPPPVGLVYGRIQSGKTRAMIASTALAFDNGFRIAVVMTSNINDLVTQTHGDFTSGMAGVMTFTKDDDLEREVNNVRMHLQMGDGRLLVVCSKGATSLQNVSSFLRRVGAESLPSIIFDDEGDQASLDTNTARRARNQSAIAVAPSTTNRIIQNDLKAALPRHVYVSVTGTPQAILLQSAESTHRPSFIEMLPPGESYIGGDHFFNTDEPEENPHHLIEIVDQNEKAELLSQNTSVPEGLRRSLLFFLVSASAAIINRGLPSKGYAHLCHPSLKNNEQGRAEERINDFLNEVTKSLLEDGGSVLEDELTLAYENLRTTLQDSTPTLERVRNVIKEQLATRKLLVINAKVKRQGIAYGQGLNFLIGGNTLGRGIAVKNLLVTYYIRDSKISQIDTMHQHARMYGYRKGTLEYTRLFIPTHLYYRFRDIHDSDKDLRTFIEQHKDELPGAFPVEYTFNLRTTRPGVLDVKKTETLRPRMHIFPNYIIAPQPRRVYEKVLGMIREHFSQPENTVDREIENLARDGVEITASDAQKLVRAIKTHSKNTWRDKSIGVVVEKVASHYGGRLLLRFRTADRRVDADRFFSTGAIGGPELTQARGEDIPTLWMISATARSGSAIAAGEKFMYPSFVIPENFPRLFMFNRG